MPRCFPRRGFSWEISLQSALIEAIFSISVLVWYIRSIRLRVLVKTLIGELCDRLMINNSFRPCVDNIFSRFDDRGRALIERFRKCSCKGKTFTGYFCPCHDHFGNEQRVGFAMLRINTGNLMELRDWIYRVGKHHQILHCLAKRLFVGQFCGLVIHEERKFEILKLGWSEQGRDRDE